MDFAQPYRVWPFVSSTSPATGSAHRRLTIATPVDDAREHSEELFSELGHIAVPTLIVRGERSSLRREQVAEIASALPDARVETVVGAGHFMIREQPEAVARLVLDFINR